MSEWVEIGKLEDIPKMGARVVQTKDGNVAVFRTARDEIFALLDHCPHKGGPLSQGIVCGTRVTCPLHGRIVELTNGKVAPPDTGEVQQYTVGHQDGHLFLQRVCTRST